MGSILKTSINTVAHGAIASTGLLFYALKLAFMLARLRMMVGLAVFVLLGWQGLRLAAPTSPAYTRAQLDMAGRLASDVSVWLRQLPVRPEKTVFGNLNRDQFGVVSAPLRDAVLRSDRFDLLDLSFADRLRVKASWPVRTYGSSYELAGEAKARNARYAVGGELERFVDLPGECLLRARLYVWDTTASQQVGEQTFAVSQGGFSMPGGGLPPVSELTMLSQPITYRLFYWVILAGLLPFVVFINPKGLLQDAGNLGIFVELAIMTLISGLALYWIVGRGLDPYWSGLFLLILVPCDAFFNFKMLAFFQDNCI